MNWYTITGIVIVAVGTLLMTYGGLFQTRKDASASERQLDNISRDLAELKGRPKSELSKDALARVERDIAKWAKTFASEKQQRKLILDQKRSEHDSSVEHTNALAREYLRFLMAVLRDAVTSYSSASGQTIAADLPEVPETVFSDDDPKRVYEGTISFSTHSSWTIHTMSDPRSGPDVAAPWIIVSLLRKSDGSDSPQEKGELMIRFSKDMKSFFIRLQQDFLFAVPMEAGNSANYETTEYEERIRNLLIRLVEFQLLQD
jgi:hypothetical protein